jgi:23S rRNA pseudouridine2605 synthase
MKNSTHRRKQNERRNRQTPAAPSSLPADEPVRLNRFIARAGVCSRREADALIAEGRVTVDGAVVTEMGVKVRTEQDVMVDGQPVAPKGLLYVLLNKPKDTITTLDDERGRNTVIDVLTGLSESDRAGLFPVGRLDRDTTGVLLLTTDGDLAHRLTHPRYGAPKLYRVETREPISEEQVDALLRGVDIGDGEMAAADQAGFIGNGKREIGLEIHEGRNRQVRRMLEALGHEVAALERVQYAGMTAKGLRRGEWRKLSLDEANGLRRSVKLKPILDKQPPKPQSTRGGKHRPKHR